MSVDLKNRIMNQESRIPPSSAQVGLRRTGKIFGWAHSDTRVRPRRTRLRYSYAGFTLIELLVVVAIIGLLSSIISLAVNNSRIKARDAKRVTDLKQIKTGMDLYFANGSGYPANAAWVVGTQLQCDATAIMTIPADPLTGTYEYEYTASGSSATGCGTTVRGAYEMRFYIENKGSYYRMNEDGQLTTDGGSPASFDGLL